MSAPDGARAKLWSLWDLIQLDGGTFALDFQAVTSWAQRWQSTKGSGRQAYESEALKKLRQHAAGLRDACERLELRGAVGSLDRVLDWIPKINVPLPNLGPNWFTLPPHQIEVFEETVFEVGGRIQDEMKGRPFIGLTLSEARLFGDSDSPFGNEVLSAFPGAAEDISEAAKCLALGRHTACVFHLMRALELAAQVVADKLGATTIDEHGRTLAWGVIAVNMKVQRIDKMTKGSPEQTKWYRVHSALESVNRAWRTPTNHPKHSYSYEEAHRVFEATKGFMQELAPFA